MGGNVAMKTDYRPILVLKCNVSFNGISPLSIEGVNRSLYRVLQVFYTHGSGRVYGGNMHSKKMNIEEGFDLSTLTTSSLNNLYDQTVESLRMCSQIMPGDELDEVTVDKNELSLLKFEMLVLDQASKISPKNTDDINDLIDLWTKVSCVHESQNIRPTDKIVMNIFRHLSVQLA